VVPKAFCPKMGQQSLKRGDKDSNESVRKELGQAPVFDVRKGATQVYDLKLGFKREHQSHGKKVTIGRVVDSVGEGPETEKTA